MRQVPLRPKTRASMRQFDLERAIERFLAGKKVERRSPKTLQAYHSELERFRRWLAAHGHHQPTEDTVSEYIHYLTYDKQKWDDHPTTPKAGVGLSPRTVNNTIRCLRIFFNWCVREGELTHSPMTHIRYQPEDDGRFEVFTDEQVQRLLQQPNRRTFVGWRDYCMMLTLVDTGMRIGELTSLRVSDVDFQLRQIEIPGAVTKTHRTRIVPISPVTTRELQSFVAYCRLEEDDFLWMSQFGERYMADNFGKMLKKYAKQAGIRNVRVSPHTFRHYFATRFLKNGGDPIALQRILGHRDMHMVSLYVNYTKADLREQHEKYSPVAVIETSSRTRKRGRVQFR